MQKILVPLGVAWVGLSLIIGLVIAFKGISPSNRIEKGDSVTKVYYVGPSEEVVKSPEAVTAKTTIGPVGPEATAQVEVKK